MPIRLIVAPSRFDRPPGSLVDDQHDLWDLGPDIVLVDEVSGRARNDALREYAAATGVTYAGGRGEGPGECAALIDSAARVLAVDVVQITGRISGRLARGRLTNPLYALVVTVQFAGQADIDVIVWTHLPARVEGRGRLDAAGNAAVWLAAVAGMKRAARAARRDATRGHGGRRVRVTYTADWNLDALLRWVRALIRTRFPRKRLIHAGPTHRGGRALGWVVTGRRLARGPRAAFTVAQEGSDHKAAVFDLR